MAGICLLHYVVLEDHAKKEGRTAPVVKWFNKAVDVNGVEITQGDLVRVCGKEVYGRKFWSKDVFRVNHVFRGQQPACYLSNGSRIYCSICKLEKLENEAAQEVPKADGDVAAAGEGQ